MSHTKIVNNKNQEWIQWLKANFLWLLLILFYITEAYSKVTRVYTREYSMLPRAVKLVCISIFIILLIWYKRDKLIPYVIIPIGIFIIGQYFLAQGFSKNSIVTLGKYLYPIVLFLIISGTIRSSLNKERLFKVFEYLLLFNSVLIILGAIISIRAFQTYPYGRFGYNGLFLTSATSTYIYIIALFYFLLRPIKTLLYNWKFIVILIASLLVGTKSIYLAIFLISIYLMYKNINVRYRAGLISAVVAFACLGAYLAFYKFGNFSKIREESGILSSILSFRNELFINRTIPFIQENWIVPNYIAGGVENMITRSQMSFIDLIYFWGFGGGIWYLWAYYKSFFTFKNSNLILFFKILMLIIISLAGNFFFYSTVPIYLLIFREQFLFRDKNMNNSENILT